MLKCTKFYFGWTLPYSLQCSPRLSAVFNGLTSKRRERRGREREGMGWKGREERGERMGRKCRAPPPYFE